MGTRCLTRIRDGHKNAAICCTIYTHLDGYPSGHGLGLAKFLQGFRVVNGLGIVQSDDKIANGMGCLAAQIVKQFKDGPGHTYLYPCRTVGVGEEYTYNIFHDGTLKMSVHDIDGENRFEGTPDEFVKLFATTTN